MRCIFLWAITTWTPVKYRDELRKGFRSLCGTCCVTEGNGKSPVNVKGTEISYYCKQVQEICYSCILQLIMIHKITMYEMYFPVGYSYYCKRMLSR
jgi:hypothetical protein